MLAHPPRGRITAIDKHGTALTESEVHGLTFSLLGAGLVPPAQALALAALRLLRGQAGRCSAELRYGPCPVRTCGTVEPGGAARIKRLLEAALSSQAAGCVGTAVPLLDAC
jgi:hypothetical protein